MTDNTNESAKHEAQAVAWLHEDGSRVITAKTKVDVANSSVKGYSIPLVRADATDGVRRGMEMALRAINEERLNDPTSKEGDVAYGDAINDCARAVEGLIAALPAQDAAKDDEGAQEIQDAKDAAKWREFLACPGEWDGVSSDEIADYLAERRSATNGSAT